MYSVSNRYKSDIKKVVRNLSYIKIKLSVVETQAGGNATVTTSTPLYYSDASDIVDNLPIVQTYGSLEHNRFILNGKQKVEPAVNETYDYQGFIGQDISDATGAWTNTPTVTIQFSNYYKFIGLTFNFDTLLGDYPNSVTITAYKDNVVVTTINATITKANDFIVDTPIAECNKIVITADKSTIPNRRFRLENVIFGINKVYTEEDILNTNAKKEVDLIASKLPTNNFNFTILDKDNTYNIENPTGMYQYLDAMQPCVFEYGYELDNGDIEWIKGGRTVSTGDIDIKSNGSMQEVTFKTNSVISTMTKVYDRAVYSETPKTLYQLALEVLQFADLEKDSGNVMWILDDKLKNYSTNVTLPKDKCNNLLQLIANAGMCILDVDRNGYIVIKPKSDTLQDFSLTTEDDYSMPVVKKYPTLQGVDTIYSNISVDTVDSDLGKFDVTNANNTVYTFNYDLSTNISYSVTTGLSVVGTPTLYGRTAMVTLTGSGSISFTGKKIITNTINISKEYNTTGERCPIQNNLISNKTHALEYATWVGDYVNRRNEYNVDNRGFPEMDCGDKIKMDTLTSTDINVDIISNEISYNGTLSGKTKTLIEKGGDE